MIGGIEADQRHEEAQVGLGQMVSGKVAARRQMRLQPVQRGEESGHGLVIGRLRLGKPGAVDAVVDAVVDRRVPPVDLAAQGRWSEIGPIAGDPFEARIENAQDIGRFIVDDPPLLPVPEDGHGDLAGVVRVGCGVELVLEADRPDPFARIGLRRIGPAVFAEFGFSDGKRHRLLKPLQDPDHQRAAGPGADIGNEELEAPGRGLHSLLPFRPGLPSGVIQRRKRVGSR